MAVHIYSIILNPAFYYLCANNHVVLMLSTYCQDVFTPAHGYVLFTNINVSFQPGSKCIQHTR